MNFSREHYQRDLIEDEAHRISRMLAAGRSESAVQALRDDAIEMDSPRAFHHLVMRISELNSQQRRGDHVVAGRLGELYIEDRRGCLNGIGVDAYGRSVWQPRKLCPREPDFRIDRGGCIPDRDLRWAVPRIDPRLEPRRYVPPIELRIDPRLIPSFRVPDYRDLTRNVPLPGSLPRPGHGLPEPRDLMRTLPRSVHGLPDPGDVLRNLSAPGGLPRHWQPLNPRDLMDSLPVPGRAPNLRDLVDVFPRPGNGLPSLRDISPRLPHPGHSTEDRRQHILRTPNAGQPMPG